MDKKNRVKLFHDEMQNRPPASDPSSALKVMLDVLAEIEAQHAPQGSQHMTIPALTHPDVQAYGAGGYAIPLIGYVIFLNQNGAIGIKDDWNGGIFSLQKSGADGTPFTLVQGWRYQFQK